MNELIKIENGTALLNPDTSAKIAAFEKQAKEIKEAEDALKAAILAEMEQKNIIKLETPEMTINYIYPSSRETFDSKTFRAKHPEMYDEYIKFTRVSASVRLKLK